MGNVLYIGRKAEENYPHGDSEFAVFIQIAEKSPEFARDLLSRPSQEAKRRLSFGKKRKGRK